MFDIREVGRWLHLEWFEHESPRAYYERYLAALAEYRELPGYRAILDLLDARERVLWQRFQNAKAEDLVDLRARVSEIAYLRGLLEAKSGESLRRSAAAQKEAERDHIKRQQGLASTVDIALANMHAQR